MMMLLQLLTALFACLLARIVWRRWKYDLHRIPSPPAWPLLGHTVDFYRNGKNRSNQWMKEAYERLGQPKMWKLQLGNYTLLVITDEEYVKSVVLSKTNSFPRHSMAAPVMWPMIGNDRTKKSLLTTWDVTPYVKEVRKIYTTSFQTSQLKKDMPKLRAVMQRMIDIIESKRERGPIDFQQLSVQFALDVMGVVMFDANLGGMDGSRNVKQRLLEGGHVNTALNTNMLGRLYCKLFPNSKLAKEGRETLQRLTDEWSLITREILEKKDPPEGEMPLWHALRSLKDPETNEPMSFNGLRGEVATAVITGMDTTGHQMGWALGMLAGHPEIADKIYDELKQHGLCGREGKELSIEDLGGLTYLNAVIKETFRIAHISALGSVKCIPRDMTVLGYRVPKGTGVILPTNRSMNTEQLWGDPQIVRPERWLSGEDHSQKYFRVFAAGPRDCIGQRLAMLELRFVIATVVSLYHMSMDCTFDDLLKHCREGVVCEARDGVNIHVTPRET